MPSVRRITILAFALDSRSLFETARRLRIATREHEAMLIVNDRADIALAAEADGVHLGEDDLPLDVARRLLRGEMILGASAGSVEAAKAAGAIEAGCDGLIQKVSDGWLDFDVAVASPKVMGKVGKLGRTLGPQGKMPSPKNGTVTTDVVTAVAEFAAGKVEFRNDAGGNVHVVVGKQSFEGEKLIDNIEAFVSHVKKIRPAAAKGTYIKKMYISATMSPSITVSLERA